MRLLAVTIAILGLLVGSAGCEKRKSKSGSEPKGTPAEKAQADSELEQEHLAFVASLSRPTDESKALAKQVSAALADVPYFTTGHPDIKSCGLDSTGSRSSFYQELNKNCPLFMDEKRSGQPNSAQTVERNYETHAKDNCPVLVRINKSYTYNYRATINNGVQDSDLDHKYKEDFYAKSSDPTLGWSDLSFNVTAESHGKVRGTLVSSSGVTKFEGIIQSPTLGRIVYNGTIKQNGGDKKFIYVLFNVNGKMFFLSSVYLGILSGSPVYLGSEANNTEVYRSLLGRFTREYR